MQDIILSWKEEFAWTTVLDILIVLFLTYQFYKLVKGTAALNISLSIVGIYIFWKFTQQFNMPLTTEILDRIISMGVIALVILFQPEIRRALFLMGTPTFINNRKNKRRLLNRLMSKTNRKKELSITPIIQSCMHLSSSNTGGLMVITQQNSLPQIAATGEYINASVSSSLLENIFYKNSPLHDGAVLITNNRIESARCILPVTNNKNISEDLGLRHRSAIGVTEQSDAIAIIVSEQNGAISYCLFGEITYNVSPSQLRNLLEELFEDVELEKIN